MVQVRGYELSIAYSVDSDERRYYVRVWRQPLWNWLVARVYHQYDMTMFRIPGFRKLEVWMLDREDRKLGPKEFATPWFAKMDIRCYQLTRRNRTELPSMQISQEQYEKMRG